MSDGLENLIRRAYLTGYAEATCKGSGVGMTETETAEAEAAVEKFLRVFP